MIPSNANTSMSSLIYVRPDDGGASDPMIDPHAQPQSRRPRGFAAAAASSAAAPSVCPNATANSPSSKGKREREKEKERTKLRERHRRAITSRMLSGLRQFGNFPLPVRADMNDVLAALAREAGWTVEPDGNTYRQAPPSQQMVFPGKSVESPLSTSSLKSSSAKGTLDCQTSVVRLDETLSPTSFDSVIAEREIRSEKYTHTSSINSAACLEVDQLIQDMHSGEHDSNVTGKQTVYVPVYVKLAQTGFINNFCQLVDPDGVRQELNYIKSLNVDGVVVDCWWGIVECWKPQKYVWSGYRELFSLLKMFDLKIQVVMAFHEYGRSDSGGVPISLPQWVLDIGKENQDIFFTDREGRRTTECLSWGVDKERVLSGRTGIEVYFDFMRSFRAEFDDFFAEGLISAIEIGLGADGELKYPSFSERLGWRYPGIGEFQCYDKYLQQNLRKAAKLRGHLLWARGPDNAGQYNSQPQETGFFCERGDYDGYYGRFFLHWYAQTLIDHADDVLSLTHLAFEDITIMVKVPSIYWWYKTASHAAELTAGYHNPTNQDGYAPVFEVLKKHHVVMKFVCNGLHVSGYQNNAFADPEGLSWQVLNSAWDRDLVFAGENTLSGYDREGCMRVVEMAKPRNDPDHRHFLFFVYQQPSPLVQGAMCFPDMNFFIRCLHGDISCDLVP